ncbi:MAG: hypothetical protein ACKVQJ_03455 [Pyrinomonadaceae bacterium]
MLSAFTEGFARQLFPQLFRLSNRPNNFHQDFYRYLDEREFHMRKRQLIFIVGLLVAVVILFTTVAYRQEAQDKSKPQAADEPTSVKKGQITPEEREYSKEYKKLYEATMITKLSELAALGNSRGTKTELQTYIEQESPYFFGNDPNTISEFLLKKGCSADAIVVASASKKVAHLSEDETFVYTQYETVIKDILKNNSSFPIAPNGTISLTRPGGLIKLEGQVIRVEDKNAARLELNKDYLLFLRYVPTANGYMMSDYDADFAIDGNSTRSLARAGAAPAEVKNNRDSPSKLIGQISGIIAQGCKKKSAEVK